MPSFTIQDLANAWKVSERTVHRRIKELKEESGKKKFVKHNPRTRDYCDKDVIRLSELLGYTWPHK